MSSDDASDVFKSSFPGPPSELKSEPLSGDALLSIGRLVRGVAELENCIDCFIMMLAEISEAKAVILLGRQGINSKIDLCFHLARIRDDNALDHFKHIFTDELRAIIKARNVVSHGCHIGNSSDGEMVFSSSEAHLSEGSSYAVNVYGYKLELLQLYADLIENAIPTIEGVLQISEIRQNRVKQKLRSHPKAQK